MDAFVSGAWRTPSRGEAYINGDWRRITRAETYRGGVWRSALSFIPPLSLTATPSVYGVRTSNKPIGGTVISDYATAMPNGGTAPYSYAWTVAAPAVTATTGTSASTQFSAYVPANSQIDTSATVVCTDANGVTASAVVGITLVNETGGL